MEHPAPCTWRPGVRSSWSLPPLKRLAAQPEVVCHEIHQCEFGGISKKPTILMVVHNPAMQQWLDGLRGGGKCQSGHTHRSLQGLDSDDVWISSRAKTYPSPLCACIAATVLDAVKTRFPHLCQAPTPTSLQPIGFDYDWSLDQDRVLRDKIGIGATDDGWNYLRDYVHITPHWTLIWFEGFIWTACCTDLCRIGVWEDPFSQSVFSSAPFLMDPPD